MPLAAGCNSMHAAALASADQSLLLVIDVQTRLAAAMPEAVTAQLIKNTQQLCNAATHLHIPIVHTEQYPRGLGSTDVSLHALLTEAAIEKTSFSCCNADGFLAALEQYQRTQIILCGMETHVCVLQTALELQAKKYQVFVIEDALASRQKQHHQNALSRMQQAGVIVSNSESLLFEWLRDASHPDFKTLSALIR